MKKQSKFFALACVLLILAISVATVLVSYGADAEYTADTDYSPVSMQTDSFSAAKAMSTSGSKTTYLTYLHDLGGNTALAIAPGISGAAPNHVYLSYRNDTVGSSKILYVGKSGVTSPEAPCDTDFLTLDIDIGALGGIPDGMSISLNGRAYTSASASSPSGNAFLHLSDTDGTLAISGTGINGTYIDTGLDITEKLAHITLVLDTREVAQGGADSIRAYAYVNGKFITEINHGFTDSTDIINEIRVDFGQGKTVCKTTDTVLVDNVNMRSFKTGEYTGNLGGVLEDSTKTLLDFDLSVWNENYSLFDIAPMKIAKVGVKDYYSLEELAKDAKSGDVIRFLPLTADRPTNLGATVKYTNTSSNLQNDGVLFAIFDADGNLISEHTSYYDSQASTDHFYNAIEQLNGKGGYIELYADVESRTRVFTATNKANTVTNLVFSLNGYTFTPKVNSWSNLATNNGHKEFIFNGPGSITTTNNTIFSFGVGAGKSTAAFNNVKITCGDSFIKGQSGVFTFNNCDISWTNDCSSGSNGFVTAFGGPTRNGVIPTLTFKDCRINHTATKSPTGTRAPFIGTNSINTSTAENPITTVVNIENCVIDTVGNLWFANANKSNSTNMLMPTPTFNIVDSKIKAYMIASAYNGNNITINVSGNTELNISKKLTEPSGSISVTYTAGNLNGQTVTYTSKTVLNIGEGVSCSLKPASATNATVNLGGKLLALASSSGYIVENPTLKANVSLGSDFNFNFYVPKSDFVSAKIDGIALPADEEITVNGETYVKVVYEGIAPAAAGISKSTVFTLKSGNREYTAKYSASIPKYINLVYSGSGAAEERSEVLLAAIARYIKAAYTYFGKTDGVENIDALISLMADVSVPEVDESALTAVNTMANVSEAFTDATLALESAPRVRFILNPAFSGTVTVAGETYTVEGGMALSKSYVDVSLSAKNIMSTVTVKVCNKTAQFNAVSYFNYLKSISNTNTDAAKAIPVVEALFNYGAAAGEYIDHVFSSEWSYDKTHHWHACTDEGCIISADREAHSFGNDGMCLCGQAIALEDGEGEFLQALGINKNIKTKLDDMQFAKELNNQSATYSFTADEKAAAAVGDMLLFSFVVKADVSTPINITVDVGTTINYKNSSKTMTYYAPTQWTRIYMPTKNAGMASVTLSTEGKVYIAEAKYENRGSATQSDLQLESGMWMLEQFDYYDVSANGIGAGKTIDLIRYGNYIYSIGDGTLSVIDASTDTVVGTLGGFGTLRQIDITDDGKYVVITGRADGVYIVNVENPASPRFISSYNSIEMATGLYISGDYAFVCNRQYGVEVVDISNPEEPRHLVNIHSGEVQSCVVYNNILYAGVWSECGVFMYDLSDIKDSSTVNMIGKITTNGKGDGMSVIERDGKIYLFAATGQHTYAASISSPLDNLCYGQGNGLDIYDVTDPGNPKWVSTSKIDGRYYFTSNDYWESEVGYDEANDRYYAYLVNTYNGVYVFDVTNLAAPVRVAHIDIPLPLGSTTPELKHDTRAIITTWNQYESRRGPVGAILIEDGKMYIAGTNSDVHVLANDSLIFGHKAVSDSTAYFDNLTDSFYDFDNTLTGGSIASLADGSYTHVRTEGQALGAVTYGSYLYVAAGNEGIKIFNKDTMECVNTVSPVSVNGRVGFANGIDVYDGKLYVAEDVAGLRVYDISGDNATAPVLVWNFTRSGYLAREVVISPEGIFSLVAHGNNGLWVINNSTHQLVKSFSTSGTMYHHNIGSIVDDRYIAFWGHSGDEHWLDFGPEGARLDVPAMVTFSGGMGMTGGVTEVTVDGVKYALKITNNKGVYTNDFTQNTGTTISGISGMGKPTVCGNYLFVSERISSKVYIYDISCLTDSKSEATSAVLLGMFTFDGNPDVIHVDGTVVYIPLGYQGIISIDTATAFGGNA